MYSKIMALTYGIENHPVFSSIKKGFMLTIPVIITGTVTLLIVNFPVAGLQNFLTEFGGGFIRQLLLFVYGSTVNFMSGYLLLSVSYYYSATFPEKNPLLRMLAMITALASFLASFGGPFGTLTLDSFGPVGVFTALVCAICAPRFFFFLSRWQPGRHRAYAPGSDLHYRSSMASILPVFICVFCFSMANLALRLFFQVGNFNELISNALIGMFRSVHNELANGLLFTLMLNLLWVFGIHGGNALDPVAKIIFAEQAGGNGLITKSFLDNFTVPGGCGATVCLLLALLLADRSRSNRELALSAAPMALFNINEVLVFGLPVVLNPILLLPFVLVPVVALLIAYGAAVSGWLPLSDRAVVWTTPVFFSGYLVAGSWRGSLIQAVILAVGTGIYLPFVRLADNLRQRQASFMLRELTATFKENEKTGAENAYLNRGDNLGIIAKSVINQLLLDIEHQEIPVLYQPQINRLGVIVGAEALLRWKFAGEPVYPPLAVALAKEDGCYDRLTWRIMEEACEGARYFRDSLNRHFRVSVNITSEQLNDPVFIQQGIAMANRLGLNENLAFEVTEETNLRDFQFISQHIEVLRACGILMYIDDFSMGQTSLDYLQDNGFSYVKLDGGLVKQITENPRSREIIGSIVTLGKNLDFQVVAEYVENEKIRDILLELGCHYFQGYLISPAATKERVKELYEEILPE